MPIALNRIEGGVASGGVLSYVSPDGTVTHIQNLNILNPTGGVRSFRAAVIPSGETLTSPNHYIYWDLEVDSKETINLTAPIILASGDELLLEDSANQLVFTLFGEVRN